MTSKRKVREVRTQKQRNSKSGSDSPSPLTANTPDLLPKSFETNFFITINSVKPSESKKQSALTIITASLSCFGLIAVSFVNLIGVITAPTIPTIINMILQRSEDSRKQDTKKMEEDKPQPHKPDKNTRELDKKEKPSNKFINPSSAHKASYLPEAISNSKDKRVGKSVGNDSNLPPDDSKAEKINSDIHLKTENYRDDDSLRKLGENDRKGSANIDCRQQGRLFNAELCSNRDDYLTVRQSH